MRRNKSVKHAKKRQSSNNSKINLVKMEKDWKKVPAQMAALLNKQVKANKKNESKLQKAVSKLEKLVQKSEAKITKANANKNPAVAKKQLKAAQKDFTSQSKTLAKLNKELHAATQAHAASSSKQNMLIALGKNINKFEAEWNKAQLAASKAAEAAKAARSKAKAPKARKAKTSESSKPAVTTHMDDAVTENEIAEVA